MGKIVENLKPDLDFDDNKKFKLENIKIAQLSDLYYLISWKC